MSFTVKKKKPLKFILLNEYFTLENCFFKEQDAVICNIVEMFHGSSAD